MTEIKLKDFDVTIDPEFIQPYNIIKYKYNKKIKKWKQTNVIIKAHYKLTKLCDKNNKILKIIE